MTMKDKHKLSPPWEGPYNIAEVIRPGTYKLKDSDGNILTNSWNIEQLRHFLPVRSISGSVQVPRPDHFRLGALGGPIPVDFVSPHNTVHSPGDPTRPLPARNHSGAGHLHSLHVYSTHELSSF
jgi:hypothetical protein